MELNVQSLQELFLLSCSSPRRCSTPRDAGAAEVEGDLGFLWLQAALRGRQWG